jgi:ATP-dependent DNA helicase RecG
MQSSIEKLRKFFRLEHENGYTNKAVIGGLASVLNLWEGEARNDKLPEEIVQATAATLKAYAERSPEERLESLKALWKQISDKVPEAALTKKTTPAKFVPAPAKDHPQSEPARGQMQPSQPQPKPAPSTGQTQSAESESPAETFPVQTQTTKPDEQPAPSLAQHQPAKIESQTIPVVENLQEMQIEPQLVPVVSQPARIPAETVPEPAAEKPQPNQVEEKAKVGQNEEEGIPEPEAPPNVPMPAGEPVTIGAEQNPVSGVPAASPEAESTAQNIKIEPATSRAPTRSQRPKGAMPGRAEAHPGGVTSKRPIALNASLTVLAGVGPKHAAMLTRLGLNTLEDMLYNYPRRYEDYSKLKPIREVFYGEVLTVIGEVTSITSRQAYGRKMTIVDAVINDGTGGLRLTWYNKPWLVNQIKVGEALSVSGKVDQYLGRLVMKSPEWEPVEVENLHTNRIVPIYALTANVAQKWLRTLMRQVVTYWAPKLTDHLPERIRQSATLPDLGMALLQAHFPDSDAKLQAARQRLAFDEIFFLQTGVLRQRRDWQSAPGRVFEVDEPWMEARLAALPFALTTAQKKSMDDIRSDLKSGKPMNRLLQGDVGSGKTVVAALAAAMVNQGGAQAAIMAPTSILAEQHYRTFQNVLAGEKGPLKPDEIRLLVGDTSAGDKEGIRAGLASGVIKIVIGTHALIEDPVTFADLQYVVVDEQHRFGVEQRAALRSKGTNPHLLVMTATPIPRSLALTLYGDLDLSVMDELPPGRQTIPTHILPPVERERAYTIVRSQVNEGHQAFIIYPLVEESEKSELLAATQEHEHLQKEIFPDLKLGLLHGRMKGDEKDAVMLAFRKKQFDILVSTTVVEVGVDVPNATVMLIEGANRFGLAQLHQLRGRVGRSEAQSFCLLIPEHEDAVENERLKAMVETNDGFILAERDLQQRGPGEFLGTRQAGYATTLKMASLSDIKLIEKARTEAQALFARDPDLKDPENSLLAEALGRFWGSGKGDMS